MYTRHVTQTKTMIQVQNNPADPYGPPLVKHVVCVRCQGYGHWFYVKQFRLGEFTWTTDSLYAKHYSSLRRARFVQSCIPSEI